MARARHNNVGFGAADFGQHTMESFPLSREAVGRFRATALDRMTILCRFAALALLAINEFSTAPTLAAADLHTAAGVMPGCRNFLAGNDTSLLIQGICFGEVTALFETFAGKCAPPDLAGKQLMRTVVDYIDRQPIARLNEPFNHLAIEAMMKMWPCKQP